jgi:hypothetical protein
MLGEQEIELSKFALRTNQKNVDVGKTFTKWQIYSNSHNVWTTATEEEVL